MRGIARVAWIVVPAVVAAAFAPAAHAAPETATPAAAAAPKAPKPPKYENLRFREDWSVFCPTFPGERCDVTDRLKALPLSSDGTVWVNVGGQARARFESFTNYGFSDNPDADDDWLLTRLRLHVDLHVGPAFRLFVEGIQADQEARELGPRPVDENHQDLLNAFVDYHGPVGPCCVDVGARVGRQEFLFGKQRVVGPLDWGNTRRTFEGVSAWAKTSWWRLDALVVRPVLVDRYDFDESDDDTLFAGVYYANTACDACRFDAYAFWFDTDEATWLKVTTDESRFTVGARADGVVGGTVLDWEVEGAYQFGEAGDGDVSAGFVTAELGCKPCWCWSPRFAIGADWASGDDDGPGGDVGTYRQLYPTGHLWFGWADFVGRQNVVAGRFTATCKPTETLLVRFDAHAFRRATEEDAAYTAAGGVLVGPADDDLDLAQEIDLQVKWNPDRHWEVEVGYSHVFAGEFLEDAGLDQDVDFWWASVTFTF